MNGFDFQKDCADIEAEIAKLERVAEPEARKALRKIGNVIKSNIPGFIPWQEGQYASIAGRTINVSVKKSKSSKEPYVIVKGGSGTGGLWVFADTGFTSKDGIFHEGSHFTDKALKASEGQIDEIVKEALRTIAKD